MINNSPFPQNAHFKQKILLIGCGDIGRRMAAYLDPNNYQITGLRRNCPANTTAIRYLPCDASNPGALLQCLNEGFHYIVITLTPSERSDAGYERTYVRSCHNLITALQTLQHQPARIIFVSSTAVYHQDDGAWVDEDSPAQPTNFNGIRLLEAETIIRCSGFKHTVVRFSGIYGPGRNRLIEQVRQGQIADGNHYTNRIHAEDCAGFLAHLITRMDSPESLYLATDSEPTPLATVTAWIAQQLGVGNSRIAATATERGNKRVSNKRMLETGYQLRYPGFREGYAELLKAIP